MTIFLLDSLLIQFQPATVLGSRRFLFWQGFWHVRSCSDLLKVFRMVVLFTSPPTNWGLVRVKFQQVNWPWNSKSRVICAPLSWVLASTIGLCLSQVLVDSWSPYWLTVGWRTCQEICWSTLVRYVSWCINQHVNQNVGWYTSQYTSWHSNDTSLRGVNCWWNVSWLLVVHRLTVVYHKFSINPPKGAYLFQAHLMGGGGGLIWDGVLFNLEKTMVSVLHKYLEYKGGKGWRLCSQGSKTNLNFQQAIWYYAMVQFRITQFEENHIIRKKMLNSRKVNNEF